MSLKNLHICKSKNKINSHCVKCFVQVCLVTMFYDRTHCYVLPYVYIENIYLYESICIYG